MGDDKEGQHLGLQPHITADMRAHLDGQPGVAKMTFIVGRRSPSSSPQPRLQPVARSAFLSDSAQ
ncbi:hypothetical protein BURKHO8Y_460019 [Burkholderia sp. 8Y]|nr:hypothetical protein BURKHO8Y_460019 [Burkholderia sp. 8Y]